VGVAGERSAEIRMESYISLDSACAGAVPGPSAGQKVPNCVSLGTPGARTGTFQKQVSEVT
jgi:hypothetical protein